MKQTLGSRFCHECGQQLKIPEPKPEIVSPAVPPSESYPQDSEAEILEAQESATEILDTQDSVTVAFGIQESATAAFGAQESVTESLEAQDSKAEPLETRESATESLEAQKSGADVSEVEYSAQSKKVTIAVLTTVAIALFATIGLALFFLLRTSTVEVPDFSNLTEAEASNIIDGLRLTLGEINEVFNETVDEGLVISQSPRPGTEVERGEAIDLNISLGLKPIEIPDFAYLGFGEIEAIDLINNMGLTLGEVTEEYSDTMDKGYVISQSPRAGVRVEEGETVDLVISLGAGVIIVPDLLELEEDEGEELLESLGLLVGTVTREYDRNIEEGLIAGQSLDAGDEVDSGTAIDLVISLGAPLLETPFDLTVWGEENAIPLEWEGVTVYIPIPVWLNLDDIIYCDNDCCLHISDRINPELLTMVEVTLLTLFADEDFQSAANLEIEIAIDSLNSFDWIHDAFITFTYEGDGSRTVGVAIYSYVEDGTEEIEHSFELLKLNEYQGIMIMTRLGLRTVNAPEIMCSDEFADAFGLRRYIEANYIVMDP